MQHVIKTLSADMQAALDAYSGTVTTCPPGTGRAPLTSPDFDRSKAAEPALIRAVLADEYATFRDINKQAARSREARRQRQAFARIYSSA